MKKFLFQSYLKHLVYIDIYTIENSFTNASFSMYKLQFNSNYSWGLRQFYCFYEINVLFFLNKNIHNKKFIALQVGSVEGNLIYLITLFSAHTYIHIIGQ